MFLNPIIPFEPVSTDQIPAGKEWIAQVKWDGVRVLTYFDGQQVKLYNRHLKERTHHYPEITSISDYCDAASIILDGEIIAMKEGKPSFYDVMKRDGISRMANVDSLTKSVPISYMVFDLVYLNGNWITKLSLAERHNLLNKHLQPNGAINLVENFNDPVQLFNAVKFQQMEGIVIKDLTSTYQVNGKDKRWRKKKFYRDLIAVVGGVTMRSSVVNALLLGLFGSNGLLYYVGHAGTGRLSHKDWEMITDIAKPMIRSEMPFANRPTRVKDAVWLDPIITVKVQFAQWIEGHTLRQPSIQALVDVPAYDCVLTDLAGYEPVPRLL